MVPMHLGRTALCAPYSNISSEDPCPFIKVPDGPQNWNLNVFWVQKMNADILSFFFSKSHGKRMPSRFPNGAPLERDTRLQGIFTSLLIYILLSYSQSPR